MTLDLQSTALRRVQTRREDKRKCKPMRFEIILEKCRDLSSYALAAALIQSFCLKEHHGKLRAVWAVG